MRERAQPEHHGIDRYARSRWKQGGTAIHDAEAGSQGLSVTQLYRELGEVPAPPAVAAVFAVEEARRCGFAGAPPSSTGDRTN